MTSEKKKDNIERSLEKILERYLFKGKILIVYGARQVGKTTLVKQILKKHNSEGGYYNCELVSVKRQLESMNPKTTKSFLGEHKIIVLDEAQKTVNIGLVLKQLIDTYPEMQIVATGSSSFDLANKINEPLTGRALEFKLYPLSIREVYKENNLGVSENLENILNYGLYPEVCLSKDIAFSKRLLEMITSQYLYKDIFELEDIKKPNTILTLLELLALQLGNEVSINELATKLQLNNDTVERYLHLLEKAFVIFRLRAFSRNLRKEITKKNKIYFYDVGIRNAILNRFNQLKLRDDVGPIWENFLIVERMKLLEYSETKTNQYFWRTHDQKEIDYIEDRAGDLFAYEFKWQKQNTKFPEDFRDTYSNTSFKTVNKGNFHEFIISV